MIDGLIHLSSAFGLSTSAGLNAYIPLLMVAVLGRFTTWIQLQEPFDALTSWWSIGALVILLAIEVTVDKIPAVDTINDAIQTFIRPAAGAVLSIDLEGQGGPLRGCSSLPYDRSSRNASDEDAKRHEERREGVAG
jgi:hypothetical protein